MFKVIKKNQIVLFAIALVMITVGYLNYNVGQYEVAETSGNEVNLINNNVNNEMVNQVNDSYNVATLGDAQLVNANNVVETSGQNEVKKEENIKKDEESIQKEKYFKESKLERENMYSEMLENYQIALANPNISEEQKNLSQNEIAKISSQKNSIMIAENLIKNKGFENVIIFVNNDSVSVVIGKENLNEAEIAQIQSIIQRELNVNIENIHISNK